MEIDRRTLIKGIMAGGALFALGVPPWVESVSAVEGPKHVVLLLGGTWADEIFATGASAACTGLPKGGFQIVNLAGGLLSGMGRIDILIRQSRGARWIGVLDDASAMIFVELARTAGVKLLSMGMHAGSKDRSCPVRHTWTAISPDFSAGGLLAPHSIQRLDSFLITESFLKELPEDGAVSPWSAPGFSSYRLPGQEAVHLHCSGLSHSEGCRLLGLEATGEWMPIPPQTGMGDSTTWQSNHWVESIGYAMTTSAFGICSFIRESCASRAFVHQAQKDMWRPPTERFVSFVADI